MRYISKPQCFLLLLIVNFNASHVLAETALAPLTVYGSKVNSTEFDTPISSTSLDVGELESKGIDDLEKIVQEVPNLYYTRFSKGATAITIRGLGFADDESDSVGTSVFVDGVSVGAAVLDSLIDTEQVDVLLGPQSILYGQNSMGGVIAVKTIDPSFDEDGYVELGAASNNTRKIRAAKSISLSERTALRVVLGDESSDGYITNTKLERDDSADYSSQLMRLKLLHEDNNGGEWRVGLHHIDNKGGNDYFSGKALSDKYQSQASDTGINNTLYTLLTSEYIGDIDDNTLTVNAGVSKSEWQYWLPKSLFGGTSGFDMKTQQASVEARLQGEEQQYDWLAGVYLDHYSRQAPYTFDLSPYYLSQTHSDVTSNTQAAFAELGWLFSPSWRLAGAARLEHNQRSMDWSLKTLGGSVTYLDDVDESETVLLPQLTLSYSPSAQHYAWSKIKRGYKHSGFNIFSTNSSDAANGYDPEFANYFEVGYRYRSPNNVFEFGSTAFTTKIHDQQVIVKGNSGQTLTDNAAKSHNTGLELNGKWLINETTTIALMTGFVEAEYDDYVYEGTDYSGRQFASTPKYSIGTAISWKPNKSWALGTQVTRNARSTLYPNSEQTNSPYTLVNAQVNYYQDGWILGVYGTNLLDESWYTRGLSSSGNDYYVSAQPREVGMRARYDF
ncbi:TonB-dependent receptor [Marinomonas transparens]|uniref:TonB-dependent receptor plug domain-containing protein n=1 Tax=Marinomonas transparens TaxID=2795388 RepID=A0A934JS92_9GAMM|nr:TonB-dependent receptor plug domain-containing protein [Marinomonas transparens]MBJ7536374.1 TonB-dependent receptor plug domain-containing protein [Marinomonas transparens]